MGELRYTPVRHRMLRVVRDGGLTWQPSTPRWPLSYLWDGLLIVPGGDLVEAITGLHDEGALLRHLNRSGAGEVHLSVIGFVALEGWDARYGKVEN